MTNDPWNFDKKAARYDEIVEGEHPLYARYREVLDALVEKADIAPGTRVLHIGTGTGNLAQLCLSRGATVVGVDPSEGMLARAREKLGNDPNIEFRQIADPFLNIPFADGSFDAIVSTYAYHHVPPESKADTVAEMFRVLKPGGTLGIGDLIFESEETEKGALNQYRWLEEEYFARIEELLPIFTAVGIGLNASQFGPVTWVLWRTRPRN